MLTVLKLIAMHKRVVDAYVGGVTQHTVWTEAKDETFRITGPVCLFTVPRRVPVVNERFQLIDGWLMDIRYKMPVTPKRSAQEASEQYSQIMEHATEIFGAFLHEYIIGKPLVFEGEELNLEIDPSLPPVFEDYVDDGTDNVSGVRITFVVRDKKPRCLKPATLFPSLYA